MIKIFGVFILLLNCQINKNPSLKLIYSLASTTNASAVTLTSLIPDSAALSPSFSETNFSYTVSVGNSTSTISFTPSSISGNTITINGSAVTSGASSSAINISVGTNTITIVVTASDGTQGTYTITVTRAGSSNNDLSSLAISSGTLSPVFAAATTSYTASITNTVTFVTVTPTASDATATIAVNSVSVTSGVASGNLAMSVGVNAVTVVVTAQDATTKTYTITVTRLSAGVKRIFVTSSQYNGNLGGITGADTKCNADSSKPADGSTYKAILVDGTNREACTTSNCSGGPGEHTDWVLVATTSYVRASDSVVLFTTNANGIFVFGSMSNSFSSGTQVKYWSGFSNATIWGASGTICTSFTNTTGSGRVGLSDQTNYTSLRDVAGSPSCASSQNLLCAEQ